MLSAHAVRTQSCGPASCVYTDRRPRSVETAACDSASLAASLFAADIESRGDVPCVCFFVLLQYERGSADLYVFGSPKNTEGYQFSKTFFGVIFANNPN